MVQTFVKRPTSPLHFEPLKAKPDDVIWPGSDDEADEHDREKKRVRIELLGKQYLEGKPLFIQSAGLVGPFEKGWRNPWAKRRRIDGVNMKRSSDIFRVTGTAVYGQHEPHVGPATVKRRSIVDAGMDVERAKAVSEPTWEEPQPKRTRRDDFVRPMGVHTAGDRTTSVNGLRPQPRNDWLKKDGMYVHPSSTDRVVSPSPTPTVRPRTRPLGTSPLYRAPPVMTAVEQRRADMGESRVPDDVFVSDFTSVDQAPVIGRSGDLQSSAIPSKSVGKRSTSPQAFESSRACKRQFSRLNSTGEQRIVDEEAQPVSHEAQMSPSALKERLYKTKKPFAQRPSPASGDAGKPMPSRLSPYVSDIVQQESATSAGLKAAARSFKPSPQAAPPSTYLPEFLYHYTKKEPASSFSKWKIKRSQATEQPQVRPRSISTSSSGSSDFAEAFEAVQARAASGSLRSSNTSSPMLERPETKSIKNNTQAMRRLTFTSSGEPKIAGERRSSRPSSSCSVIGASALVEQRNGIKQESSKEDVPIHRTSTKSSGRSVINGVRSKNSEALPEAQIVPKAPIQVPSGPSTDLMETDEQSPKFVNLEEEDSYFDLSTQAAMLKAQRAFRDDVVSPVKTSLGHTREGRTDLLNPKIEKGTATPRINGLVKRAVEIKPEPEDQEPMSTQAIADAISPFTVTTVKKRPPALQKRTSFAPSLIRNKSPPPPTPVPFTEPSPTFQKPLSMVTTPSDSQPKISPPISHSHPTTTSKPPSSLTSSALPNGTLTTETSVLQDGQQPQHDFDVSLPLDPFFTPSATANGNGHPQPGRWDLDAAIGEAESFLGDWNVEAEARKAGSSGRKKDEEFRGILSVRGGS